jgi:uncharacterized protein YukE
MSSVEQAGMPLAGVAQQPTSLAAAVATGELWMEAGVAERAAAHCDQAIDEIDDLLRGAHRLTRRVQFGNNGDGNAAATRFVQAGQDYIDTMRNAQRVFANMAKTYRAAGRTVIEVDAASEQMLRGRSE